MNTFLLHFFNSVPSAYFLKYTNKNKKIQNHLHCTFNTLCSELKLITKQRRLAFLASKFNFFQQQPVWASMFHTLHYSWLFEMLIIQSLQLTSYWFLAAHQPVLVDCWLHNNNRNCTCSYVKGRIGEQNYLLTHMHFVEGFLSSQTWTRHSSMQVIYQYPVLIPQTWVRLNSGGNEKQQALYPGNCWRDDVYTWKSMRRIYLQFQ